MVPSVEMARAQSQASRIGSLQERTDHLLKQYSAALREYALRGRKGAVKPGYRLGQLALADGRGIPGLLALHQEALAGLSRRLVSDQQVDGALRKAGEFLAAALVPFVARERALRESNLALRRMNEREEETAQRVARALHDEASQLVAAVQITLDGIESALAANDQERLRAAKGLLERAETQLRQLSRELWPSVLDVLGLVSALKFLADRVAAKAGLRIEVEGFQGKRLPRKVESTVYQVVQEALENVAIRARASRVKVRLRRGSGVVRGTVTDNGLGIRMLEDALADPGAGLGSIRERLYAVGGDFRIKSAPGQGAELAFSIPLEDPGDDAGQKARRGRGSRS